MSQNNSAKFTFLYLLSLIALSFFAIASGMVLFQVINKNIADIVESYGMRYNIEALRFALSAMLVSAPIYLVTVWQINKNLFNGKLPADSGIRKWLTYFILLVASFVILGWAIAVINNFFNGELTLKFILKALTVVAISGAIFSYYLIDIRREQVSGQKSVFGNVYLYATIVAALAIFVAGIFFVESPAQARQLRIDQETINRLNTTESAIQSYFVQSGKLPENLDALSQEVNFTTKLDLQNPSTKQNFDYTVTEKKKYRLCTDFLRASLSEAEGGYPSYAYPYGNWEHEAGRQCFERTVLDDNSAMKPVPVR
jgi:type II secretory pathway pseudopilin PulG